MGGHLARSVLPPQEPPPARARRPLAVGLGHLAGLLPDLLLLLVGRTVRTLHPHGPGELEEEGVAEVGEGEHLVVAPEPADAWTRNRGDLVGHELRQAREERKDVDAIEERWLSAGGAPAPPRGASPDPVPAELRSLALDLLDELDSLPRPLAADEPEGFEEILAAAEPVSATPPAADLEERVAGAWLGRAAGCVLGKPVENIPREGIRAIAQSTGNWPLAGWPS